MRVKSITSLEFCVLIILIMNLIALMKDDYTYLQNNSARWTDRYLFLGSKDESPLNYTPSRHKPIVEDFILANNQDRYLLKSCNFIFKNNY